ncbi:MAG: NlpC/P60 family protein [Enterobacteriaceae bacterium]
MRLSLILLLLSLLTGGCSTSIPPPGDGRLGDPIMVVANLSEQLQQWRGTPYRDGGMSRKGIDCSGFIYRTFQERFAMTLPRTTKELMHQGVPVDRSQLRPGDLLFFRTGSGKYGLHVGVYYTQQQFLHASTRVGVTLSSLTNPYWKGTYLAARRL